MFRVKRKKTVKYSSKSNLCGDDNNPDRRQSNKRGYTLLFTQNAQCIEFRETIVSTKRITLNV